VSIRYFSRLGSALLLLLAGSSTIAATPWSEATHQLAAGDFNGDGKTDLLYIASDAWGLSGIALSNGTAPAIDHQSWTSGHLGIEWHGKRHRPIVGDFNGDGRDDVLLQRNTSGGYHYVLLADSSGKLQSIGHQFYDGLDSLQWSENAHRVVPGDFNGDGRTDVFLQSTDVNGANAIYLADTSGAFGSIKQSWSNEAFGFLWSMVNAVVHSGDFDGDGRSDLFVQAKPRIMLIDYEVPFPVPHFKAKSFGIVKARVEVSGEIFYPPPHQTWSYNELGVNWSASMFEVQVADFTGDGRADIFLQSRSAGGTNRLLATNSTGHLAAGDLLQDAALRSAHANQYTLHVANFDGGGGVGIYLQAKGTSGSNSYTAAAVTAATAGLTAHEPGAIVAGLPVAIDSSGRVQGSASVSDTGEATYSIPLDVPPGTNGMTPVLGLAYGHRNSGGLLGAGWTITGLSRITRCPKTYAQDLESKRIDYFQAPKFCLDGNRLRLESGTYGANGAVYRTELESFAQVTSIGTTGCGPTSFIVRHKSGLIYEYGTNGQQAYGTGTQCNATPTIGEWPLSRIVDRQGNRINFLYTIEGPSLRSYRIDSVVYTENSGLGLAPAYKVQFLYEDKPANEIHLNFLAGSKIKQIKRLDRIEIKYNNSLVRAYDLSYEQGLSSAGNSRLASIRQCGGSLTTCLAPTVFSYQDATPGVGSESSISSALSTYDKYMAVDISGDGRDDLIYQESGQVKYRLALATGGFGNSQTTNAPSEIGWPLDYNNDGRTDILTAAYSAGVSYWHITLGGAQGFSASFNTGVATGFTPQTPGIDVRAADLNGDGWDDIVSSTGDSSNGYWFRVNYRSPSGTFATAANIESDGDPYGIIVPSEMAHFIGDPRRRSGDFDGDGRADLLAQGAYHQWAFTSGETTGNQIDYEMLYARFGDVNGDGKEDVVWRHSSNVFAVGFGDGSGGFTTVSGPSSAGYFPSLELFDWNGDGKDDLLIISQSTGTAWLSYSTGEALLSPIDTGLTFGTRADFNGDGLDDLLYKVGSSLRYRLHQGIQPDRLRLVTDGFGNSTEFSYSSLTGYALYSQLSSATFPLVDHAGPTSVVTNVKISDGTGNTYDLRDFSYEGARTNLHGRGFAGFSKRSWVDSRDGTVRSRAYRQDFPFIGFVTNERYAQSSSGNTISESAYTHLAFDYGSGTELRRYPYVRQTTTTDYEVGGSYNGVLLRTISSTNTLDSATGTTVDRVVETTEGTGANGLDPGVTSVSRTYVSSLFTNWSSWCIGRPSEVQVSSARNSTYGALITRTSSTTWNSPYCRPSQVTVEPGDAALQVTTVVGYDNFGNVNSTTVTGAGMPARTNSISFGATGQFAVTTTNALQHQTTMSWDYALGLPTGLTDANGISTSWQHDTHGRRTRENRPDGTYTTWQYIGCAPWCGSTGRAYIFQRNHESTGAVLGSQSVLLDMMDRPLTAQMKTLGSSEVNNNTLMHWQYDGHGREIRSSVPRLSQSGSVHWNEYSYDLLGRTVQTSQRASESDPTIKTAYTFYEGLTTRTIDPLGKTRALKTGATGLIRRSSDHSGYGQTFHYDSFGDVVRVTDSLDNTLQSSTYNKRGMLMSRTDMELGSWGYSPNALGEVRSQTDAKGQTIQFDYDLLGRLQNRYENEGQSTFTWGNSSAQKNIGRLAAMSAPSYSESYAYDSLGRPATTTINADTSYQIDYTYDTYSGLLRWLTYPTSTNNCRLKIQYGYTNGILTSISDASNAPQCGSNGHVYWTANESDAFGNLSKETFGNGLVTRRAFDSVTGALTRIRAGFGGSTSVQDLEYAWDLGGNLSRRKDWNQSGLTESFEYDDLYRLRRSQLNGSTNLELTFDALGNVKSKSGIGEYNYHSTKKHQLISTANSWSFTYDLNGNMTSGRGASVQWTSYNMPSSVSHGGLTSTFSYTPDRRYWKQVAGFPDGTATTVYIGGLLEKVSTNLGTDYRHMIRAGSATIVVSRLANGVNNTYFVSSDHLGSSSEITDSSGAVVVSTTFDPFGRRRGANWTGLPSGGPGGDYESIASTTRRGFTGHTMLDNIGFIHMNGRVQDPILGRFISADPFITEPFNTQNYNRYSYVYNNPLRFTDPSGFDCDNETKESPCETVVVTGHRQQDDVWSQYPFNRFGTGFPGDPCHSASFDYFGCLGGAYSQPRPLDSKQLQREQWASEMTHWSPPTMDEFAPVDEDGYQYVEVCVGRGCESASKIVYAIPFYGFADCLFTMGSANHRCNGWQWAGGVIGVVPTLGGAKTSVSVGSAALRGFEVTKTGIQLLLPAPKMVKHHIFNVFRGKSPGSQVYRDFFKKHGIDLDKHTIEVSEGVHRQLHAAGNNWTSRWKSWIDANPNATTKEVYQQAGRMMDDYGIGHLPIGPY
jgi:RHS repeat-associated protein